MSFSFLGNNFTLLCEKFLNVSASFLLSTNWTNSNDVSHIFELLSDVNIVNEIIHHADLFLKSTLFLESRDSAEGITHNGDKHIHEYK